MIVDDASSTTGVRIADASVANNGKHEEADPSQRWRALEKLVSRPSPFGAETGQLAVGEFEPFENVSRGASVRAVYCRCGYSRLIDLIHCVNRRMLFAVDSSKR